MTALFILLMVIVTLPPCHNQSECGRIDELYQWANTSQLTTLSCVNLCPNGTHKTNCSAWYRNGSRLESSLDQSLTIRADGHCSHYYCQDETRNVTLKTVVVTPRGE